VSASRDSCDAVAFVVGILDNGDDDASTALAAVNVSSIPVNIPVD
jgi:hypothetical protein